MRGEKIRRPMILNNAFEQNYLRSEIGKTRAALERLQPAR